MTTVTHSQASHAYHRIVHFKLQSHGLCNARRSRAAARTGKDDDLLLTLLPSGLSDSQLLIAPSRLPPLAACALVVPRKLVTGEQRAVERSTVELLNQSKAVAASISPQCVRCPRKAIPPEMRVDVDEYPIFDVNWRTSMPFVMTTYTLLDQNGCQCGWGCQRVQDR